MKFGFIRSPLSGFIDGTGTFFVRHDMKKTWRRQNEVRGTGLGANYFIPETEKKYIYICKKLNKTTKSDERGICPR